MVERTKASRTPLSFPHRRSIAEEIAEDLRAALERFEAVQADLSAKLYVMAKKKKVGRNDPCPCGSAEKYKKCCERRDEEFMEHLKSALDDSLGQTAEELGRAASALERLASAPQLSTSEKLNIALGLAHTYQRQGHHAKALEVVEPLLRAPPNVPLAEALLKQVVGVSYVSLGRTIEACSLFEDAIATLEKAKAAPLLIYYLDAGKAFRQAGAFRKAQDYWERAVAAYTAIRDEDHLARAQANLGSLLLHARDDATQQRGAEMIEESSSIKQRIGDIQGLATNYCNLGLYYRSQKRFARALAFHRRDLAYSRMAGDLSGVVTSLINLADLYVALRQLSAARKATDEAHSLSVRVHNLHQRNKAAELAAAIEETGRDLGARGEAIGPTAPCACGLGKSYIDCCGEADFEPVDPQWTIHPLEAADEIQQSLRTSGVEPSHMDLVLRDADDLEQRQAWTQARVRDGWVEYWELPDASNLHLSSARLMAHEALKDPDGISKPVAAVILGVAATEAFINQVAFFVEDAHKRSNDPVAKHLNWTPGTLNDFLFKSLVEKWEILGSLLCGSELSHSGQLWKEFVSLVGLRNELVHFKAIEYERVIPPARKAALRDKIPARIRVRDVHRSWPVRLLTPEVAKWSVDTAGEMIRSFRRAFGRARRRGPPPSRASPPV